MTAASVRTHLVALEPQGGTWTILEGGLSDHVSDPQIAVIDRAGLPPITAHASTGILRPGVQVLVRGMPRSYAATLTKAEGVWDALHRQHFAGAQSAEGVNNPVFAGFDEQQRPVWSLNFIIWTEKE